MSKNILFELIICVSCIHFEKAIKLTLGKESLAGARKRKSSWRLKKKIKLTLEKEKLADARKRESRWRSEKKNQADA